MKTLYDNPKAPNKLFVKINGELKETNNHWCCGECGMIFNSEEAAHGCCRKFYCACGNERYHYMSICSSCRDKQELEKAIEVEYTEGMVVLFGGDTFYSDWDDMMDSLECNIEDDEDWPEWAQPCKPIYWQGIDISSVLENEMEDLSCEDVEDQLTDVKELYDFIKKWNSKQNVCVWSPIPGKKIPIPKRPKK